MVLGLSSVAVVVAFGLVYLHVLSAQTQFELDRKAAVLQTAQVHYEDQRVAVAHASAPANIMRAALRLGMRQPGYERFVLGVGGPASPTATAPAPSEGAIAPAGISDWSRIKSDVQGSS